MTTPPLFDGAQGSLTGSRVVDLTTNVAGPWATQILAELGADVVKIERPSGDDTRGWGPPFWGDGPDSVTYSSLNRGKRSVVLDLRSDEGRRALEALVRDADVLVQNMRPGALERLGFGAERLRKANPRLVYAEMSGFGHVGPRSDEPAYDPLMQAYSGLMSLVGEDERPPSRIPVSVLDMGTGMWTAIAVLDALRTRDRTGVGAHLQMSLLETALSWMPFQLLGHLASGRVPRRQGSGTVGIVPYQAFETADGHLVIAAGNQRLWESLCAVIERPDLVVDERFRDNSARVQHREELLGELTTVLRTRATDEWFDRLQAAGVPCSPLNTLDEVVDDEQVVALDAVQRFRHPTDGHDYAIVRLPINVDGRRHRIERLAPRLGEHTDEVLAEIADVLDGVADAAPDEPAEPDVPDGPLGTSPPDHSPAKEHP